MRISWLEPDTAERIHAVLSAWNGDWSAHFTPDFQAPPPPPGMTGKAWPDGRWRRAAEHVARIQRVAQVMRREGVQAATERYAGSAHAVEIAALLVLPAPGATAPGATDDPKDHASDHASGHASLHSDRIQPDLIVALLTRAIDEQLVYGPYLQLLEQIGLADPDGPERALSVYREFCAALVATTSSEPMWSERVSSARDGLAGFHVRCGQHEQAHALFAERHAEETDSLLVALAASRAFLMAGAIRHATDWLTRGAERAEALGRADTADKLRAKCERIRARL